MNFIKVVFIVFCMSAAASAQVPVFEENFNYTAVSLVGVNGWGINGTATSFPVAVNAGTGLSYPNYAGSGLGNAAFMAALAGDKLQSRTWPAINAGNIYGAMLVQVTAANAGDYFFTFFDNGTFRARVYVKSDGAGIQFGLSKGTGNVVYTAGTPFALNATHLLVVKYNFFGIKAADDSVSLFVNPVPGMPEPAPSLGPIADTQSDLAQIGRIVLRQNSASSPAMYLDGIRVATDWLNAVAAAPSRQTDIISSGNETPNLEYTAFSADSIYGTNNSARVWSFTVRDGGAAGDPDSKPSCLAAFSITAATGNTVSDWAAAIKKAALFSDTLKIADADSVTAASILFGSSPLLAALVPDNQSRVFDLRITFDTTVTDNQQFGFRIRKEDAASPAGSGSYSLFSDFPELQSSTAGDLNRIEVTATQLGFTQQPTDVGVNAPITPAVAIEAKDRYANRDLDFTASITVTATGAPLQNSPVTAACSLGIALFSNLRFTTAAAGVTLLAQRSSGGWGITSNSFVVTSGPLISVGSVTAFGNQIAGTVSAEQSYTVSASNVTGNLVIAPPQGFQISLSSGTGFISFPAVLALQPTGGTVAPVSVYVRFAPASANGASSANILHQASGAADRSVAVSGNAIAVEPAASAALAFGAVNSSSISLQFTGGSGTNRVVVARQGSSTTYAPMDGTPLLGTVSPDFTVATDQGGGNKIVYDGTGSSVTVTGLQNLTAYAFAVFEYNTGTGTSRNYRTTAPGTGTMVTGSRYQTELFPAYSLQSDILYGISGTHLLDVYTATGDTARNRPLIIFIHGGGFKSGDKVSNFGTLMCGGFARRGYVVASINYRLTSSTATLKEHFEAMIRAVQDARAAVRFFRKNWSVYGIDTTQIFLTGSSAGSHTALHLAYLNEHEIPSYVDMASLGTLEGSSGNPGYSSAVSGVMSNWGALGDFKWMQNGDVPVFCTHGTADATVPYDSSFADGPFKYGSAIINARAQQLNIRTGLRLFYNTGHTLDNNSTKQDSAYKDMAAWLYSVLRINNPVAVQGETLQPVVAYALVESYPNPFNPSARIRFSVPETGHVSVSVYNAAGELVRELAAGQYTAGYHSVVFDAGNLPSGMYFCRLISGKYSAAHKMLLVK